MDRFETVEGPGGHSQSYYIMGRHLLILLSILFNEYFSIPPTLGLQKLVLVHRVILVSYLKLSPVSFSTHTSPVVSGPVPPGYGSSN